MLGLAGPSGRAGLGLGVGGGVGVGGPGVLEQHGPCHSGRCCLSLLDFLAANGAEVLGGPRVGFNSGYKEE